MADLNEEIKKLFLGKYKNFNSLKDIFGQKVSEIKNKKEVDGANELIKSFKNFKHKIRDHKFELTDYTNYIKNTDSYFIYFIESKTNIFGSYRVGNNYAYMLVTVSENNDKYRFKDYGNGGLLKEDASKDEANVQFQDYLCPFLIDLLGSTTLDSLNVLVDKPYKNQKESYYNYFSSKQFLSKIVYINSLSSENNEEKDSISFNIVGIFSEDAIDYLVDFFEISKENKELNNIFEKNYYLTRAIKEKLEINNEIDNDKNLINIIALSRLLWDIYSFSTLISIDNPNIIFYGAPGTGKTYFISSLLNGVDPSQISWVQIHPAFSYEDFIEGIKPTKIDKEGKMVFSIVNGVFKDLCKKALTHKDHPYFFIADEINRTNLSSLFGESLSLLEKDYRFELPNECKYNDGIFEVNLKKVKQRNSLVLTPLSTLIKNLDEKEADKIGFIKVRYSDKKDDYDYMFGIPNNVIFIGLMNDVDKSIDSFDLALRRRFSWIHKGFDENVLRNYLYAKYQKFKNKEAIETYIKNIKAFNKYISNDLGLGKSYEFGHAFFMKITTIVSPNKRSNSNIIYYEAVNELFDKYISTTLKEYLRTIKDEKDLDEEVKKAKNILLGNI